VEIVDHPRYTRLTRGPRFFDAARFPDVQFLSEPYTADLLRTGGPLHGRLRMHGVQRRERFVIAPSRCARPGRECPIVAEGIVQRGNYDLDGWRMALLDEVRFTLHVRLRDVDTGAGAR
jgi:polyisoprenoid-binding protein YceI